MLDNKGKAQLLGEPFGTANSKLRKMLLFELARQLGLLENCYRCKEEITDIDTFSIEHKKAWSKAPVPVEAFYDLNNISFSHIRCNVSAGNIENKKIYSSQLEKGRVATAKRYADPERYAQHLARKRKSNNGAVAQSEEARLSKGR